MQEAESSSLTLITEVVHFDLTFNLSGQAISIFDQPHSKKVVFLCSDEISCFQFLPIASCPFCGH